MIEDLNRRPQKTEDVVYRKIDDQFILIPIRSHVADLDSIYTLNETSARIYELMDGKRDLAEIKTILIGEFDAEGDLLAQDILDTTKLLESIGSIR